MSEHTHDTCPRAAALETRMTVIEEAAASMARHSKWLTGTLVTLAILGAGAILGVYIFSVERADAAVEKATEVQQDAATVTYHDTDVEHAILTERERNDAIQKERDKMEIFRYQQMMKAIEVATPPSRRAALPPPEPNP